MSTKSAILAAKTTATATPTTIAVPTTIAMPPTIAVPTTIAIPATSTPPPTVASPTISAAAPTAATTTTASNFTIPSTSALMTAAVAAAAAMIPLTNHSAQQQAQSQQQLQTLPPAMPATASSTTYAAAAAPTTAANATTTAATTRTMQSDEDFNIRFVNLVRQHKCLYDKKVPEYRNRDNQEKAWALISKETRESVIHCKERWRNLRACLSRYIKQQSGSDPQHKPYYLTEHMAFLLPFLKSTRNSAENGLTSHNLSTFFQQQAALLSAQTIPMLNQHTPQLSIPGLDPNQPVTPTNLSIKQSLSENDEETIDAFDPALTGGGVSDLSVVHSHHIAGGSSEITSVGLNGSLEVRCSSVLSDTASANTLENFIPDVQIKELDAPAVVTEDGIDYSVATPSNQAHSQISAAVVSSGRHDSRDYSPTEAKRIKTECHASEATTSGQLHLYSSEENSDMEFFRSILADIAHFSKKQKRKFKIGVLELIDDVAERFPATPSNERATNNLERSATNSTCSMLGLNGYAVANHTTNYARQRRTSSSRDWRK